MNHAVGLDNIVDDGTQPGRDVVPGAATVLPAGLRPPFSPVMHSRVEV
jgi:hypothetical protein